jgi:hypothetical protein
MHLFDTTDPQVAKSRPKFWITIIVVSAVTWAVAALGLWLVKSKKWIALRETLSELRKGNREFN